MRDELNVFYVCVDCRRGACANMRAQQQRRAADGSLAHKSALGNKQLQHSFARNSRAELCELFGISAGTAWLRGALKVRLCTLSKGAAADARY